MKEYQLQNSTPPPSAQSESQLALVDAAERQAIKESRGEMIAQSLAPAYARASNIPITPEESTKLAAPFSDGCVRGGAKGKDNLLYIPHIHLSDRLNGVLGIGQWALVRRAEKLGETIATSSGGKMQRIYADCVLLIRGAVAAEAIGVGTYHPNNPNEDYSSGVEQAVSDALTRCCKRLSIGSQVWDPAHNEAWLAKSRAPKQGTNVGGASNAAQTQTSQRRQEPPPVTSPANHAGSDLAAAVVVIKDNAWKLGISDEVLDAALAKAAKSDIIPWRTQPAEILIGAAKTRGWNKIVAFCDAIARERAAAPASAEDTEPEADDLFGQP